MIAKNALLLPHHFQISRDGMSWEELWSDASTRHTLIAIGSFYTNTLYVQNTVLDYSRRKFLTWTFSHCNQHTILLISKFNIHMYLVKQVVHNRVYVTHIRIMKTDHSRLIPGNSVWQWRSSKNYRCREKWQWTLVHLLIGIHTVFWLRQPGVKGWHISFHSIFSALFLTARRVHMLKWWIDSCCIGGEQRTSISKWRRGAFTELPLLHLAFPQPQIKQAITGVCLLGLEAWTLAMSCNCLSLHLHGKKAIQFSFSTA